MRGVVSPQATLPGDRQRLSRLVRLGGSAGGLLSAVSQTFIAVSASETQLKPVSEDAGSSSFAR